MVSNGLTRSNAVLCHSFSVSARVPVAPEYRDMVAPLVSRPGLPHIRAGGFPALGSSHNRYNPHNVNGKSHFFPKFSHVHLPYSLLCPILVAVGGGIHSHNSYRTILEKKEVTNECNFFVGIVQFQGNDFVHPTIPNSAWGNQPSPTWDDHYVQ